MSLNNLFSILKGGAGSGNIGHAGRIGHRGGSAPKNGLIAGLLGKDAAAQIIKAYSYQDKESGYSTTIDEIYQLSLDSFFRAPDGSDRLGKDSVLIKGRVLDKDGNQVGDFKRRINNDKTVEHHSFEMKEEAQNQGFGGRFYKHSEEAYKQAGIEHVLLVANVSVGGYAWARMGFDFASKVDKKEMTDRFKDAYKSRYGEPSKDVPKTAYEMAAYVGPDGRRLGKDVMLFSDWAGKKNLSDTDIGYQVGKEYYASKGK